MRSDKFKENSIRNRSTPGNGVKVHSITRRLVLSLVITVILVSTITISALYFVMVSGEKKALLEQAEEFRAYLSGILDLPLWNYDHNTVRAIGKTFSQNELVVKLIIKNHSGITIYSMEKKHDLDLVSRSGKIYRQDVFLGEFEFALTKQHIEQVGRKLLSSHAIAMIFILFSLLVVTGLLVRRLLKKPLDDLNGIVRSYAAGKYDSKSAELPYLEFRSFGNVLAQMGETINEQMKGLQKAEQKYRGIFENAMEGIFQSTPEGRYLNVNPAFAKIHGYDSPEELITRVTDIGHQHYVNPEDRARFLKAVEANGYVEGFEAEEYRRDGSRITVSVNARSVRGQDGDILYYEGSVADITGRKRSEEELKRHRDHLEELVDERTAELVEAKEKAETANRAKSVFLANMSHELRTPLNAVLGFAQLISVAPDTPKQQMESLGIITRSGEHLLNLINNILDISKIESGRVLLEESATDLDQLIQEMRSLMYVKAEEKGLDFTLEQLPDFPRNANVDAGKLRQVLINLIGNAVKYTKTGGVILQAGVAKWESPESARVRFEVKDSGPGIRVEDMERIFQPFEQLADQPVAEAGTGLGLTICKQYVELMRGQLGVTSKPGIGSVFYFEIPVVVLPASEMPAAPRHGRVIGIEDGQPRYRLLIVEDQPENRLLLYKLLEPLGFDLREAANGQEAVEIFEQWHPHLIWMDVRMPVMDGSEATRRIKLTEAGARTKVIALTAHALEDERREILASGCDDFVRKPYRDSEIFDALARHLGMRFQYADEYPSTAEKKACELNADRLFGLPRDLTDELSKAVELLDGLCILEVIRRISDMDHALGEHLRCMAENLKYKELLEVLDSLAQKRNL